MVIKQQQYILVTEVTEVYTVSMKTPDRGDTIKKKGAHDSHDATKLAPFTGSPKLTRKQQAFADKLLNNPKMSATQAVVETYNAATRRTAEVIASENLSKPEIMRYLNDNAVTAETTVIDVMNYSRELGRTGDKTGASYAGVALASAKEILDRVHGKSRTPVDITTKAVNINIDLTGVTD